MEGKHEWQVSMIMHWPQNLSTSVANQYKFEGFFLGDLHCFSGQCIAIHLCQCTDMYRGLLISVHHDAPVNRDTPSIYIYIYYVYIHKKWYCIPNQDDVIKWKDFPVTGHLCGEFTCDRWIPLTQSTDFIFDLRLNKRLSKQPTHR